MKKLGMLFFTLLFVILVTGCEGTEKMQKLVCTNTQKEEGMDIEQVISMTYKNDKLNYMSVEINTKITDSIIQENWENFKNSMNEENPEYNKDGVVLKIEADDKNYEYKTLLDIDLEKATVEALESQGFGDLKKDNSTLEENKKLAEKDGAVCEVKSIE